MKFVKTFSTAALSLAFAASTVAFAAAPRQVQDTTVTTSASSSTTTPTTKHKRKHHARTTTTPDGTTMSTSHSEESKSSGYIDPATGMPASNTTHNAQSTESVKNPDGTSSTRTDAESHSTTNKPCM